jgi:hypothetical protein
MFLVSSYGERDFGLKERLDRFVYDGAERGSSLATTHPSLLFRRQHRCNCSWTRTESARDVGIKAYEYKV